MGQGHSTVTWENKGSGSHSGAVEKARRAMGRQAQNGEAPGPPVPWGSSALKLALSTCLPAPEGWLNAAGELPKIPRGLMQYQCVMALHCDAVTA